MLQLRPHLPLKEEGRPSLTKEARPLKAHAAPLMTKCQYLKEEWLAVAIEILDELEAVPPATASPTKASVASALKTIYGHKRMPRHGRLSGQAGTTKETMSANRI